MATIRKRENGKWQARVLMGVDANGKKQFSYVTCNTKKEASAKAAELEWIKKDREITGITVSEAVSDYIEARTNILSPTTLKSYKQYLRNKYKDIINKKILTLTKKDIQMSINAEARTSSPKTTKNVYGLLLSALKEHDIYFNVDYPKAQKQEMVIPSDEEVQQLLASIDDEDMLMAVTLAATLGLRRGEICALTWEDIDFKKKTIRIDKSMAINEFNEFIIKSTKTTDSIRTLPLPDSLLSFFKNKRSKGRILSIHPNILTERFIRIVKRNNMKHFRFHDLRHYYASVMLYLQIPTKYAKKFMGHSATSNTLERVYQHLMENKEAEMTKKINNYFESVAESVAEQPKSL